RKMDGVLQGIVNQVLILWLLRRMVQQRWIGRRVLWLVIGDGLEVAGVGHDGRVTFHRVKEIHGAIPVVSRFMDYRHDGCSCSHAAAAPCSGVKPNFFCNSFSGADAPKVFMPNVFPPSPTYRSQPKVELASTDTRAVTAEGRTLSR